jgi:hypothetical protein
MTAHINRHISEEHSVAAGNSVKPPSRIWGKRTPPESVAVGRTQISSLSVPGQPDDRQNDLRIGNRRIHVASIIHLTLSSNAIARPGLSTSRRRNRSPRETIALHNQTVALVRLQSSQLNDVFLCALHSYSWRLLFWVIPLFRAGPTPCRPVPLDVPFPLTSLHRLTERPSRAISSRSSPLVARQISNSTVKMHASLPSARQTIVTECDAKKCTKRFLNATILIFKCQEVAFRCGGNSGSRIRPTDFWAASNCRSLRCGKSAGLKDRCPRSPARLRCGRPNIHRADPALQDPFVPVQQGLVRHRRSREIV